MAYLGVDTVHRFTTADAKNAVANGVSFVCRYLVPQGMGKDITAAEAKNLHDAGLGILLCWEIGAADIKKGAEQGAKDGARAKALAQGFGVPSGTTIFYACDYLPVQGDFPAIEAYLRAAKAACAPYDAGLYGCAKICDHIGNLGICTKFWQCVAWSDGRVSQYTSVYQYQWSGGPESLAMAAKLGFSVDMDKSDDIRKAGLWMPKATPEPEPWYKPYMDWGAETGLMKDGRPNDNITRAETITVVYREDERLEKKNAELEARIETLETRVAILEAKLEEKVREAVLRRLPDDDRFGGLLQ